MFAAYISGVRFWDKDNKVLLKCGGTSKYYQTEIILEEGERIIGVENVYVTPSDQYANFRSLNFVIDKD